MANQGHSADSGDNGDEAESYVYKNKFKEMQKYIPFLETMISRLEKTNDKSREGQLLKMKSLLTILSSPKKKLKLETLMKCETVLEKLMEKVEKSTLNQAKQNAVKENKERDTDSVQDSFRFSEKRDDIVSSTTQTADPSQSVADIVKSLKLAAARSKQHLSENQNVAPKDDDWEPASLVTSTDNENFVTSSENKVNVNLFQQSREKLKNLAVSNQLPSIDSSIIDQNKQNIEVDGRIAWSVKVQGAESETQSKCNRKNEVEDVFNSNKLCRTNAEHISIKELWNPENVDGGDKPITSDCSPTSNRQKWSSRLPETLRSSKSPINIQMNNTTSALSPSEPDRGVLEKSEEPSTPKSLRAKLEQEIHKVHRVGVSTGGALRSLVNKDDRKTSPIKAKNDSSLRNDKFVPIKKDIDTLSSGLKNNTCEKDSGKSTLSSKVEDIEKWKRPVDPRRRQSQEMTRTPLIKLAQPVAKPNDSIASNIVKKLETVTGDKQDPRIKYGTHFNVVESASSQDANQSPVNSDSSSILANMSTEDLQRLVNKNVRNLPSPPPITKEILETVKGSSPTSTHWKSNTFNTEVKQGSGSYHSAENFQRYPVAHTTNYHNKNISFDQQRHPVYDNSKDNNYVAPRPSLLPTPNMIPAEHLRVPPSHVAAQDPRLINSRARNIDAHKSMNKFSHSSICDPRINQQRSGSTDNRIGIDPRYSNSEYSRASSRERWPSYAGPPANSSEFAQETFHPQNRILDQSREREQQRCRMTNEQFSPVGQWPVQQHQYNIPSVSNYMPCISAQSVPNSHSDPRHNTNQHFYGNRPSNQHIESSPPGQRLPPPVPGTHFGTAAKRIPSLSERDPRRRSIEEMDSNKRSAVNYKDRRSRHLDPRNVPFPQNRCNERKKEDKNVDSLSFPEKQLDFKPSKEKEIISPLNSLYENTSVAKTGKGYGFQNFRIPKIKRETSHLKSPPPQPVAKESDEGKVGDPVSSDDKISMDKSENVEKVQEPDNEKPETNDHVVALKKEDVTQELIEALIRKSFESGEGKKLLEQAIILDNLNDKLKSKKLRKIQQILASDTEDSDYDNEIEGKKETKVANSSYSDDQCDLIKSKVQKSKRIIVSEDSEDNQESKPENSNDSFDQLKKRGGRRKKADSSIKIDANKKEELESIGKDEDVKRGRKRRSPLELLQEDIREMFISEGVVTATGYRMCRLLKEAKPGVSIEEISRSEAKRMVEEEADDESESKNENRKKRRGRPKCKKETFEDETDEILDQNIKRTRRRTRNHSASDEYADEKSLHNVCGDTEDNFDEFDAPLECRKYRKASGSKKLLQKSDVTKVRNLPCVVIEKTDITKLSKNMKPHVEDLSECDSEDSIHMKSSKKLVQRNVSKRGRGRGNISRSFKKDANNSENAFSDELLKSEKPSRIDRFTSQESFRFKRCREKRGPYILQKKISDVIARLPISKVFETNEYIGSNKVENQKDIKSSEEQVILKTTGDLVNNSKCSVKKPPTPKKQKKKKPRWQLGIIRKKVIYKPKSDLHMENVVVNKNENFNVSECVDTNNSSNKHCDSTSFQNSEIRINVSSNDESITGSNNPPENADCVTEKGSSLGILKHNDNIDKFQSELLSDEKEKDVNELVSNVGSPSKEIQNNLELEVVDSSGVENDESNNIELIPSEDIPSPNMSEIDSDVENKNTEKKSNGEGESKQVEVDESNVLDTSYAFNGSTRYNCKLCYFFGKAITSHYKHQHPTHEVYISRLSIEESSQAIKESIENHYDSFQFDELKVRGRKKIENLKDGKKKETCQYFCRMCDLKTSSLFYFQEHQTTHTGEYRYQCDICSNVFVSKSSFKGHFYNHHQGLNLIKGENWRILLSLSSFDNKVFGYICSSCNFVQMTKENVEKHISNMHTDCETNKTNVPKVICINMSKCNFMDTDKIEECTSACENITNMGEQSVTECGENETDTSPAECTLDNSQKTTNNLMGEEHTETNSGSVEETNLIGTCENKITSCQNSVEVHEISLDMSNEDTNEKKNSVCGNTDETILSVVNEQTYEKEVSSDTSTSEKLSNLDKSDYRSDSNDNSSIIEKHLEYFEGYIVNKCPERKATKVFKHAFMASKCQEKQEEQLHIKRLKQMEEVSGNIKLRPNGTSNVLQLFDFINLLQSTEYSHSPKCETPSEPPFKTNENDTGLVSNDIEDSTLIDEKRAIEAAQAVKLLGEDCHKTNINEGNTNQDHIFFNLEGDLSDNMLGTELIPFNTSFTQVLWRPAKRVIKPCKQPTDDKVTEDNEPEINTEVLRELMGCCGTENNFSIYPNQVHRLCNTVSEDTNEKINSDCNILDSHKQNLAHNLKQTDVNQTTIFTKDHDNENEFSEVSPPPAVAFELNKKQSMPVNTSKAILTVEVGSFIAVMYEQNKIVYTCKVQGCIFATVEIDPFLEHLQLRHRNFNWDGICQTCCLLVFDTSTFEDKKIPLSSAFEHLLDKHTMIDKTTNCFTLVTKVSDTFLQADNGNKRIQNSKETPNYKHGNSSEIQNKFVFKNSNLSENNDTNSDEDSVKIIDDPEGCQHLMSTKDCSSVKSAYEVSSSNSEILFPNTHHHLSNLMKNLQDSGKKLATDSGKSNVGKLSPKIPVSSMCSKVSLTCSNIPSENSELPSTHSDGSTENLCEEKPKAYLRMRRLSGDMLSVPKTLEDEILMNNEDAPLQDSQMDLQDLNDEQTDGENDNVPFLKIANVVSLNPYAANSIEGFEGLNSFLEESSKESVSPSDVQEDSVVAEKCTVSDDPVIVPNKSPVILKKVGKPSFVVLSPVKNFNSAPGKSSIHVLPSTAFPTSGQPQSGMKLALTKSAPSGPTSLVNLAQIKPGQIFQNPNVTKSVPTCGKVYRTVLPKTTLVTLKISRVPTQIPSAFSPEPLPSSEIPENQQESLTGKNSLSHNLPESDSSCIKECDTLSKSDWSKVDNSKTKRFSRYCQDSEYWGASKLPTAFESMRTYQKLCHLYKCMDRCCVFSTDSASSFMNHCTQRHAQDEKSDWQQCPYCHATPSTASDLKDHITLEHGHCLFQCAYCFFRGMAQCYIVLHQNMKHISGTVSVLLCNKLESVPERQDQLVPLETVVLPYICSQGNCRVMLYNPKDFLHHLEWQHTTLTSFVCDICETQYLKPARLVAHYKLHSLAMYQCRHCLHGSETEEEIQHHLCNIHHNQPALAILRNFNPNLILNKHLKEVEKLLILDLEKGMSDDVLIKPTITEDSSEERNLLDIEDFLEHPQTGRQDTSCENRESQPELADKVIKSNSVGTEDHDSDIEIIESVNTGEKGTFSQSISEDDEVCIISEKEKGFSKSEKVNADNLRSQALIKENTDGLKNQVTEKFVPDTLGNQTTEKGSTDNLSTQAMENRNVDHLRGEGNDEGNAVSLICSANEKLKEADGFLNTVNHDLCRKNNVSDKKIDYVNKPNTAILSTLVHSLEDDDNTHNVHTPNTDVSSEFNVYLNPASVNRTPEKIKFSETQVKVEKDSFSSPSYSPGLGQVEESSSPTKQHSYKEGLIGDALFRCGNIGCCYSAISSSLLREHLQFCDHSRDSTVLSCVHCNRQFKSANSLLEHLRVHGIKRYSCSLCSYRASKPLHVSKHLKQQHRVTATEIIPAIPQQSNTESDMFIVCPKGKGKSRRGSNSHLNSFSKTVFKPDESHLLPFSAILKDFVHCSLCSFKTKVRSNMKRHLDLHLDPSVDPSEIPKSEVVNPVPCLSRKEMMFDKMTNLAASSIMSSKSSAGGNTSFSSTIKNVKVEEEFEAPKFVPESQRYVCGVVNCNYLTCTETMLRYHIRALHLENVEFHCPHCSWETVVSHPEVSVDRIASHLRIHDTRLYKCAHCLYCHYHRHVVERHLADKHPEKRMFVHVIREPETDSRNDSSGLESAASSSETALTNFNWVCGFCDFRCGTRADVLDHTSSVHNIKSQFKCSLCPYRSSSKSNFETHFNAKHQGQSPEVLDVYRRIDYLTDSGVASNFGESFDLSMDTTPLWSRSKIRVRHIRGILIEDLNEELKHLRSTSTDTVNSSNQKKLVQDKNELVPEVSDAKEDSEKIEVVAKDDEEGMFGSYGKPHGNLYVCPLCNRYRSKIKADMRDHIYRELNYAKWVCTHCRLMSCSRNSLQKHSARVHVKDRKPEAIAPLTPDKDVEEYVEAVLTHQNTIMKSSGDVLSTLKRSYSDIKLNNETEGHREQQGSGSKLRCEESDESSVDAPVIKKSLIAKAPEVSELSPTCSDVDVVGDEGDNADKDGGGDVPSKPKPSKQKKQGELICKHCEDTFTNVQGLKLHIRINHLNMGSWICGHCNCGSSSEVTLKQHCKTKHSHLPEAVINNKKAAKVKLDDEFWEREYGIQAKKKLQLPNAEVQLEEDQQASPHQESIPSIGPWTEQDELMGRKCNYCNYRCRNASDLRNHEMRHWVQKPFKCGHCSFEAIREYEIKKHSTRAHPQVEVNVIEKPVPIQPDIKPLRLKRRHEVPQESSTLPAMCEKLETFSENMTSEQDDNSNSSSISKTAKIFRCFYCPLRAGALATVHEHWVKVHKTGVVCANGVHKQALPFRYKELALADILKGKSKFGMRASYLCEYCKIKGTLNSLKRHHEETHGGLPLHLIPGNNTQFECVECHFLAGVVATLRKHFEVEHKDKQFRYFVKTIPSPMVEGISPVKTPDVCLEDLCVGKYICLWCEESCETENTYESHHELYHSHLSSKCVYDTSIDSEKKYRYQCPKCVFLTNNYPVISEHLKRHLSSFQCVHCNKTFTSIGKVRNHTQVFHPGIDVKYSVIEEENLDNLKTLIGNYSGDSDILSQEVGGAQSEDQTVSYTVRSVARKSTSLSSFNKRRKLEVARKSTNPLPNYGSCLMEDEELGEICQEEFSFYGRPPSPVDMCRTTAAVNCGGTILNMNIKTFSQICNIFPEVRVKDLKKEKLSPI